MRNDRNGQQRNIIFPADTFIVVVFSMCLWGLCIGCSKVVDVLDDDTATGAKISLMERHAGVIVADSDTTVPRVYCGLTECAENEICCFASQQCFDPATDTCGAQSDGTDNNEGTDSASIDSDTTVDDSDTASPDTSEAGAGKPVAIGELCYSNADCAADAFCNSVLCMGPGTCQLRTNDCDVKKPFPAEVLQGDLENDTNFITYLEYSLLVCGCDGRNYESECAAYAHGVRVSGVTETAPCGGWVEAQEFANDESLPSFFGESDINYDERQLCNPNADMCGLGEFCCDVTFTCMPEAERERCFVPDSPGYPCTETFDDCRAYGWETCQRPGCGSKGVCAPTHDTCNEFLPVCGCDGVTYLNICAANNENVSIAYEGECTE